MLLSAVIRVELPRFLILSATSDSKSLNTSLLEVSICSKNEGIFIRNLRDYTFQIIFDAWWASINVGSKQPIACNNSRHVPSWRFYLQCGVKETRSPAIICIVCHQVLRHPSEHGTSSMAKYLLAKAHIAKLNQITESEGSALTSSTVDETVLAILKRQGSRGITIVCSHSQIIFDIQFIPYSPKDRQHVPNWQLRTLNLPNFIKTRGIDTSCSDAFRPILHGTLYRIWSYNGHINHYAMTNCCHPLRPLVTFAGWNMH